MRTIATLAVSLALVDAATMTYPPVMSSGQPTATGWAATLTVSENTVSNSQATWLARSYCYNGVCGAIGPTIEMVPGDELTLTLLNELGANTAGADTTMNSMRSPNTTNLHTHGLHIDPTVDSVFLHAAPGASLTYHYKLPLDHAPGLHWYHSHAHGASALQVMGGLVGAILVKPAGSENLPDSIIAGDAHVVVLTQMTVDQATEDGLVSQGCGNGEACDPATQPPLCTSQQAAQVGSAGSPFVPFRVYSYGELSAATGSSMSSTVTMTDSTQGDLMVFANGAWQPSIAVSVGSATTLRLVAAWGANFLALRMSDPSACAMSIIAWDGVYLRRGTQLRETLFLMAGTRVEVQVKCTRAGTFTLETAQSKTVLHLVVSGTSYVKAATTTAELAAISFPAYLADMCDDSSNKVKYSVHMSQGSRPIAPCGGSNLFWFGAGEDCSAVSPWGPSQPSATSSTCPFGFFSGQRGDTPNAYTSANKLVTKIGDVNEWSVYGLGRDKHPLHLHVHHMQIVAFECGTDAALCEDAADWFTVGEWRDVLPTFEGKLTVRFRASDLPGETVMHCHFLRHEDLGMMDTILVLPADSSYAGNAAVPTNTATACVSSDLNAAPFPDAAFADSETGTCSGVDDKGQTCPPEYDAARPCPPGCTAVRSSGTTTISPVDTGGETTTASTPPTIDQVEWECMDILAMDFGAQAAECGDEVLWADAQSWPVLTYAAETSKTYTLMLIDRDAGSDLGGYDLRSMSPNTHAFYTGIAGAKLAAGLAAIGSEAQVASFNGPQPPASTGCHRYHFIIYEETGTVDTTGWSDGKNFDFPAFARNNGLVKVALSMFRTQNAGSRTMDCSSLCAGSTTADSTCGTMFSSSSSDIGRLPLWLLRLSGLWVFVS